MEIENKYLLLTTGIFLIVSTYYFNVLYVGSPTWHFGFVPITDVGSAWHDIWIAAGYVFGVGFINEAIQKIRESS